MRARWEDIYTCPRPSVLKFVLFLTNLTQKSRSKPAGMRMDLQPPPQKNSGGQYSIL
ncbi:hypothetical protein BYT27DRAFT_7187474 [Phlegmacium glaucopus]|nr:hypothetical protein BYT27DRAFT_7187474 [Phlegmacium glaucopus]